MKVMKLLLILLLSAALAFTLWYFRPWSEYSPARMAVLQDDDNLVDSFQRMGDIIPYREVSNGENGPREFSRSPLALPESFEHQGKQISLTAYLEESSTTGLIVIKGGKILHEQYFNGANEESLFTSWSVAKSFVATAIAMAHKQGLIESFDDKAEKYAPQYAGTDYGQATIKGLLAMSTGIDFIEEYASDESDIRPFFFDSFVLGKNPDEQLKKFSQTRPEFSDFHYISSNSHVLSAILRGVYNKPLSEIISEQIWQRFGMEADAQWMQHVAGEQGQALGYCCLNARLRDYARFGQFYLDVLNGDELKAALFPDGWAQSLRQPASEVHKRGGQNYAARGYSWHFWLPSYTPGVFQASGVYGQYIWIDADNNLVIVKTSGDAEFMQRYLENESALRAIGEHYAAQWSVPEPLPEAG